MPSDVLTGRARNRALLGRQLLLRRAPIDTYAAVEHLVGLQAQAPQTPYLGLWSRVDTFDPASLSTLLAERRVVRIALMRSTLHLVTADDCLLLRGLVQPHLERLLQSSWGRRIGDIDRGAVTAAARVHLDAEALTFDEVGRRLAAEFPGSSGPALAQVARTYLALVQPPPRGLWRTGGPPRHTTVESWLGRPVTAPPDPSTVDSVVLRYLGAYGPASVLDAQAWAGVTRLGEVFDRLRPRLRVFRGENGRELFDLPASPRPDPDTPAPVRFLPEYDNVLLSHADRTHVMDSRFTMGIFADHGRVLGGVLVDGTLGATWRIESGRLLVVQPVRRLSKKDSNAIAAEGRRVLRFVLPDPAGAEVRLDPLAAD